MILTNFAFSCFAVRPLPVKEPPGLRKIHEKLTARGCDWKRDFSLQRVERARATREGLSVEPSSPSFSDYSGDMRRPNFRDRERAEERKASEERSRRVAEQKESRSEDRSRQTPSGGRLPPPPPPPPPSRSSGLVPAKCSSLPSSGGPSKGPRPAASDGEDRPLASRLADTQQKRKEDGGKGKDGTINRRLADLKRKEVAKDGSSGGREDKDAKKPRKDKQHSTPEPTPGGTQLTTPITPGALYNNAEASASFFAQVLHKDDRMYLPSSLTKSKAYSEMTLKGAKFFAAINRLVVEYDESAQEDRARIDEAKTSAREAEDRVAAEKEEMSKVIESLRAELKTATSKCADVERRNIMLESAKITDEAEIARLTRNLRAADELLDSQVSKATILAKQEVEQMFQDRIVCAMRKVELLDGDVKNDMLDLACIEANVELIEIFTGEDPPSFAQESKKMDKRLLKYAGAYERYNEVISGIRGELTIPPLRKDLFTEIHDNEPVELSAARAGIQNLSGSNFDLVASSPLGLADSAASAPPIDTSVRVAGDLATPLVTQEIGGFDSAEVQPGSVVLVLPNREGDIPSSSGVAPLPGPTAKKIEAIEELAEKSGAEASGAEDVA